MAASMGLNFEKFDILMGDCFDVLTITGIVNIATMLLRVKPFGLFVLGPPCGWWVWISSSIHGRHSGNVMGNTNIRGVHRANHLARVVAGLIRLAVSRDVRFILEQPSSSMLPKFPAIQKTLRKASRGDVLSTILHIGHSSFVVLRHCCLNRDRSQAHRYVCCT